jgi:hypothetical protein
MTDKKKKKKVNNLNLKECEAILQRLQGQNENKYYQDVLNQYRKLIPAHKYAIELNKVDSTSATMPIIIQDNY